MIYLKDLWIKDDHEFEQGVVRIVIASIVLIYFSLTQLHLTPIFFASLLYLIFSIAMEISCYLIKSPNKIRRLIGIVIDITIVSYALLVGGEIAAPFYGGYLWISIANGFRFGRVYLYFSTILGVIAFSLVLIFNAYWQQNSSMGLGLLIWQLLLPLYVSLLLKKLETTIEKAEKANRTKSEFLANMSHELRTPLNAIIGYSEMLEEDAIDNNETQTANDLNKIITAGRSLLTMINDILDLSKVEAGKAELHIETIKLDCLISEVEDIISPLKYQNNNYLQINNGCKINSLTTDHNKIRQILINILSNALKFTAHGTVKFDIGLSVKNGIQQLKFCISDTGIGMTEEQIKSLYKPFKQADSSTTKEYGGTGLGLTISKHFIDLLGGKIEIKSTPLEGSTFTVLLPLHN